MEDSTFLQENSRADIDLNSINPPIYLTSTFEQSSNEQVIINGTIPNYPGFYSRYGNPNVYQAAKLVAGLENCEAGLMTSSGMGAITLTILSMVRAGDHVVAQYPIYGSSYSLFKSILPSFGVETDLLHFSEFSNLEDHIKENTKVIYIETPANPNLAIVDISYVGKVGREQNIKTIIDNTFATPINQKPADFGIDIILHSATKYLAGHSDIMAGVIVGSKDDIDKIWKNSIVHGNVCSPFNAWLLVRGLRTLKLRVEHQSDTAFKIAEYLTLHEEVEEVLYPGLENHQQNEIARQQMKGFGGVVSFKLKRGYEASNQFVSSLKLIKHAPSLGGSESLIIHPVGMLSQAISQSEYEESGISHELLRLSVGLESSNDLIEDIENALG